METYRITDKSKKIVFALIGVGVFSLLYGVFNDAVDGQRIWANALVNSFFFLGIGLFGTFFLAVQYCAEASWSVLVKRIFEAFGAYIPVGGCVLLLVLVADALSGGNYIYHWMDPDVTDPASEHYDELITGKSSYLNKPFFFLRAVVYLSVWVFFTRWFRKRSLQEDLTGDLNLHRKNVRMSALFIILFAVTSSACAWDWIMSIDTHWFSTIFGWYVFSGMWVSGLIMTVLIAIHLKKSGYLSQLNANHLHDLGKWIFAICMLWCYLWFFQFMLIWYAGIPEETVYYVPRALGAYKYLFYGMFVINFGVPFFALISRDSKRNKGFLITVGSVVFLGHWLDVFLLVMPGTVGDHFHIGLPEVGMFLGFLGLFLWVVLTALTKAPVVVQRHPFIEECIHHEI